MAQELIFGDVRLPSGVRLRYAEQGPREGRAMLLLHGYTDSWFSFSRVLPLLPREWRVIVPDQRGHGDSDRPEAEIYTIEDFARDAIGLLDALRAGRATVAGHSMGSFVAQRVAALAPERVERLVLVGSASTLHNEAVAAMKPAVEALSNPVDPGFIREFQASTVHRPVPPEFLESVIAESGKVPAHVWKATLRGFLEESADTNLAQISAETLIVWGEYDAIFPRAEQEKLARGIANNTRLIYADVGHAPHWEAPAQFVRDLTAFCG